MRVFIKNKIVTLRGGSSVTDENGQKVFSVRGKMLSPTHKKFICDASGKKLFTVRNKFFRMFAYSAYVSDSSKQKIARVKHPFFGLKKFIVEGYKDEILIDGEFFSRHSTIMRNGNPIGTISREITLVADAFCLEADEADIPFLIALVIAIDNIIDRRRK